jgi:exodeoxyribonuclease V alpha subunit
VDEVEGVQHVYLLPFYRAELGAANAIQAIQQTPSPLLRQAMGCVGARLAGHRADCGVELTEQQRSAVRAAVTTKLVVLTGGPRYRQNIDAALDYLLLDKLGQRYVLASPTGRAAKRLSEATGAEAKTIHRLLEYSAIGGPHFRRDRDNPLRAICWWWTKPRCWI